MTLYRLSVRRICAYSFACNNTILCVYIYITFYVFLFRSSDEITASSFNGAAEPALSIQDDVAMPFGAAIGTRPVRDMRGSFFRRFGGFVGVVPHVHEYAVTAQIGSSATDTAIISQDSRTFRVEANVVASIIAVVKTPMLYWDTCNMDVVYQMRDLAGRAQVNSTSLQVSILLANALHSDVVLDCSRPDEDTGIGSCSVASVNEVQAWFSSEHDVDVVAHVIAISFRATDQHSNYLLQECHIIFCGPIILPYLSRLLPSSPNGCDLR